MEEFSSLFVAIGLLILLAATSMRYGVDSRDGYRTRRGGLDASGIVWDVPSDAPKPVKAVPIDETRPASAPADCGLDPCAA